MYIKDYTIQLAKGVLIRTPKKIIRFFEYLSEFRKFRKGSGNRALSVTYKDAYPCLADKVVNTPFDAHYTYHPAWAARIIAKERPLEHVDISSILSFAAVVSAFVPVKFYDYRPAKLGLPNFHSDFADLKALPFENESIASLSCMHTIEHIGLGRYGDELDAEGDLKAIAELKRVLKSGGSLLFVTPVGKPKVAFNAHRVYAYEQILAYFAPLTLADFSLVTDEGIFIAAPSPDLVAQQQYGCGCFWFKKS